MQARAQHSGDPEWLRDYNKCFNFMDRKYEVYCYGDQLWFDTDDEREMAEAEAAAAAAKAFDPTDYDGKPDAKTDNDADTPDAKTDTNIDNDALCVCSHCNSRYEASDHVALCASLNCCRVCLRCAELNNICNCGKVSE